MFLCSYIIYCYKTKLCIQILILFFKIKNEIISLSSYKKYVYQNQIFVPNVLWWSLFH